MPLIHHFTINENTTLLVWHITEEPHELHSRFLHRLTDLQYVASLQNLHWLASRAAIAACFDTGTIQVVKDEYNKPSLLVDGLLYHVSITHSFDYAAVLISSKNEVAIDMEKFDKRIERVKNKFASDEELHFARTYRQLTLLWSAKETLYKFYGKKAVLFKSQLSVDAFSDTAEVLNGHVHITDYNRQLPISVYILNDYCLTYIVQ
ncbi:MAG: 4'-phosphopantetheinyl transferase family protein [Bacteroidota bacterium]|jgi:4'-phosphopantetheinyl transferase